MKANIYKSTIAVVGLVASAFVPMAWPWSLTGPSFAFGCPHPARSRQQGRMRIDSLTLENPATGQGETEQEALKNIQVAIQEYLAARDELLEDATIREVDVAS